MPTPQELEEAQAVIEAAKAEKKKIEFDADQQAKVEQLIRQAKSEAAKELRAERDALKATSEAAQAELAAAKEALSKAKTPGAKKEAAGEVEMLQATIAEMKSVVDGHKAEAARNRQAAEAKAKEAQEAREQVANYKRDSAIQAAASKVGFYDPADIAESMAKNVKWDDEAQRFVVLGGDGVPRMNALLESMTLEEYCKEIAIKKSWLVKGDVLGGSGSKPSDRALSGDGKFELTDLFGPKCNGVKINAFVKANGMTEYHRMKEKAKSIGLIA